MPFEISGGSSLYAVPERCRLRFGIRLAPGLGSSGVVEQLERLAASHRATLVVDDTSEPFETPLGDALLEQLNEQIERVTGAPAVPCGMPCWTDAHSFVDLAGSIGLVFGPGDLQHAHRPDEHIDLREVVGAARILAGLLAPASLALLAERRALETV